MKPCSPPPSPPSPPPAQAVAPPRSRAIAPRLTSRTTTRGPLAPTLLLTPLRPASPGAEMERPPNAPKKARQSHGARASAIVFTCNNYTADAVNRLSSYLADTNCVSFAAFGREVGAGGTPHLQGYACAPSSDRQRPLSIWRANLPGCHVEPMKGTVDQNYAYCTKVYNKKLNF